MPDKNLTAYGCLGSDDGQSLNEHAQPARYDKGVISGILGDLFVIYRGFPNSKEGRDACFCILFSIYVQVHGVPKANISIAWGVENEETMWEWADKVANAVVM